MGFDAFTPLTNEDFAYLGGGTTRANEWNMLFKTSFSSSQRIENDKVL